MTRLSMLAFVSGFAYNNYSLQYDEAGLAWLEADTDALGNTGL